MAGTCNDSLALQPHFSSREMASKRESELLIDPLSMDMLQTLRNDLARPMVITSAYRSHAHNHAVGGATGSLYLQGKAFDVVLGNHDRHAFIATARKAGFTGIETYPEQGIIHIDTGRRCGAIPSQRLNQALRPNR
ncbi:D-Ala-D-Ala carboxypeptidase family metallohydrolase [Paracoccus sp. 08]|uniref:D-Ala-D-Ala carboxypeptidase family metallohydrolase n=1 Tax=Paracoccus sp. 08 TaxID=2606624 RepID=UPI002095F6AF|nr:D-Ala-D-Ala carboxypeptidase family metallohydrolase [Paracoccus sp. 08]MCO6362794.1 DUF882 domain-containing protein [Paracoccus sp. 08]